MATPSRGTIVAGTIGIGLVGVLLLQGSPNDGPPLDPRSDAPDGTSALVSLLEGLGTDVELSVGLPDQRDDVALVLDDQLDEDQTRDVLAWTRAGGTLVVTDPASLLTPGTSGPPSLVDETMPRGICTIEALEGVEQVDAGFGVRFDTAAAHSSCLGSRDFAFVVARS